VSTITSANTPGANYSSLAEKSVNVRLKRITEIRVNLTRFLSSIKYCRIFLISTITTNNYFMVNREKKYGQAYSQCHSASARTVITFVPVFITLGLRLNV